MRTTPHTYNNIKVSQNSYKKSSYYNLLLNLQIKIKRKNKTIILIYKWKLQQFNFISLFFSFYK